MVSEWHEESTEQLASRARAVESAFRCARSFAGAVALVIPLSGPALAATWSDVDFWTKWPDNLSGPADLDTRGYWAPERPILDDLYETPDPCLLDGVPYARINPVHGTLLFDGQDGKVVLYRNRVKIFDLDPGASDQEKTLCLPHVAAPPFSHEPFCSGHMPLADGRLLIVGGRREHFVPGTPVTEGWASIFDPTTDAWTSTTDMPDISGMAIPGGTGNNPNRYYPTCTLQPDGTVLVTSGDFWTDLDSDNIVDEPGEITLQEKWVVFDPVAEDWTVIDPSPVGGPMPLYPHVKMLPHGLFWDGPYGGLGRSSL